MGNYFFFWLKMLIHKFQDKFSKITFLEISSFYFLTSKIKIFNLKNLPKYLDFSFLKSKFTLRGWQFWTEILLEILSLLAWFTSRYAMPKDSPEWLPSDLF